MSEDPHTESIAGTVENEAPRRRSRGIGTALLALLSVAAAALAGYVFWRVEWANPAAAVESRLNDRFEGLRTAMEERSAASDADLTARIAGLEEALTEQGAALDATRTSLADAVAEQRRQAPPDARDWRLAEVEYLLRVANNRLLLERDAATAERLLGAADAILEELDDFALFEVRTLVAEERLALREAGSADTQTLFLRLEAIKDGLGASPARVPEYFGATEAVPVPPAGEDETAASPWGAFLDRFSNLYEFRTREGIAPRPLLRPDEAVYLEFNLRLAFERAQLGVLRNDQLLYRTSLDSARRWIEEHLDAESPEVQGLRAEVDALLRFGVDAAPPDISRSLARLRELAPAALTPSAEPP